MVAIEAFSNRLNLEDRLNDARSMPVSDGPIDNHCTEGRGRIESVNLSRSSVGFQSYPLPKRFR